MNISLFHYSRNKDYKIFVLHLIARFWRNFYWWQESVRSVCVCVGGVAMCKEMHTIVVTSVCRASKTYGVCAGRQSFFY